MKELNRHVRNENTAMKMKNSSDGLICVLAIAVERIVL